jgi:apolipoprotein D and lipocalin family protein
MKRRFSAVCAALCLVMTSVAVAQPPAPTRAGPVPTAAAPAAPLVPLPSLEVAAYMGTWYQVLWIPNRFQSQCVSDTTASYRDLGNGALEVTNRCLRADGSADRVIGVARPPAGVSRIEAGRLQPARLEVSFLPSWLRWTGLGWGAYWVIDLAPDGRYAIVSEASREYLWVLSRQPVLTRMDDAAVRERLKEFGFDIGLVQAHLHKSP